MDTPLVLVGSEVGVNDLFDEVPVFGRLVRFIHDRGSMSRLRGRCRMVRSVAVPSERSA